MNYRAALAGFFLLAYLVAGRLIMHRLRAGFRAVVWALLNIAIIDLVFFNHLVVYSHGYTPDLLFAGYVGLVSIQYLFLRAFSRASNWLCWLPFFVPIALLILLRCLPHMLTYPGLVGFSYMAFRCSRLATEVRSGAVPLPQLGEYLGFAFFLPTFSVGPINTYANHCRGFAAVPPRVPAGRAALRVLVGLAKFEFLGALLNQLSYDGLLRDGHFHEWIDLPVAIIFFYLYLYCNFSGCCDLAIGAAALIGIPVQENFNNPFAARNIKEFWNRWHMTLSHWMRDLVFVPLSKFLVRLFGPAHANHAIALAITVVFLLVGIWHGVGWNFAIYGLIHALGLVANHYYTIALKKRLGREGFKAYMENRWIHGVAVALTFAYCAASLAFFANTLPQLEEIFRILR